MGCGSAKDKVQRLDAQDILCTGTVPLGPAEGTVPPGAAEVNAPPPREPYGSSGRSSDPEDTKLTVNDVTVGATLSAKSICTIPSSLSETHSDTLDSWKKAGPKHSICGSVYGATQQPTQHRVDSVATQAGAADEASPYTSAAGTASHTSESRLLPPTSSPSRIMSPSCSNTSSGGKEASKVIKRLQSSDERPGSRNDSGDSRPTRSEDRLHSTPSDTPSFYVRKEFQGNLIEDMQSAWDSPGAGDCEAIVLITDPGQDNDDEMALLLLSELVRRGEVSLVAVVANLRPASRRAALTRGTLDILDMHYVPVGIGTDGGSDKHSDKFSAFISKGMTGVDYFSAPWEDVQELEKVMGTDEEEAVAERIRVYDGEKLLENVFKQAADKSLNLICISSLKDASQFLRNQEELFLAKVKSVAIMGGLDVPDPVATWTAMDGALPAKLEFSSDCSTSWHRPADVVALPGEAATSSYLLPSDAHNNVFDIDASKFFYHRCQEMGVPLIVVSRHAAYGCPVQKYVYDLMVRCPVPHPTVCRLQRAQRDSIESLWSNVCVGDILPARCDQQWFCDTFCGGCGASRSIEDSMWDLVKTFNMYDPLAILAALPNRRDSFFDPTKHIGPDGTLHLTIGDSPEHCGISSTKADDLHDFMMTTWIRAAGRPWHGYPVTDDLRPAQLDQEQLTSALTPMRTHSDQALKVLNINVLRLLDQEWPKLKNSSQLTTWRDRDELMRSIGPEMLLVDPETIQILGRIPHSAEGKAITMETAAERAMADGNKRFFIEMFSHRWHSPFAPDDRFYSKARVLCEWAKYRSSMGFKTFFWIDYACINQSDISPGVTMLPLYVSCCNNILCYDTPAYELRAWCRVERLMFTAFVAPNNEFVGPDFEYQENAEKVGNNELKPQEDGKILVPDPTGDDAQLSYESDGPLIAKLKTLCSQHWSKCWKEGLMNIVEEKVGLQEVRELRYGGTQLRVRRFH